MRILGVGTFQDGGLNHNNPVLIATAEARNLYPDCPIDMLVSAGTGTGSCPAPPAPLVETPISPRGFWNHRFIVRIYRSFMNSMDGEKTWSEFHNQIPQDADRYIRLNVKLNQPEPALDAVSMMPSLVQCTNTNLDINMQYAVRNYIYATSFYFELSGIPVQDTEGKYYCSGVIYCRFGGTEVQTKLLTYLSSASFFLLGRDIAPENPGTSKLALPMHEFERELQFSVSSLDDSFSILLAPSQDAPPINISGSPFTIQRLIIQQGLDMMFGGWTLKRKPENDTPLSEPKKKKIGS